MASSQKQSRALRYKGSPRHKLWGPHGVGGSICPDWTHDVQSANEDGNDEDSNKGDVDKHPWPETVAQTLLDKSIPDGKRRYATARSLPFCAQSDGHGTWHGYPISWREVPASVKRAMIERGDVTMRDIKRQMKKDTKTKR